MRRCRIWVMGGGPAEGRRGSAAFPIPDHLLHRGTSRLRATCGLMHSSKKRPSITSCRAAKWKWHIGAELGGPGTSGLQPPGAPCVFTKSE
jgi:hypothetical protein